MASCAQVYIVRGNVYTWVFPVVAFFFDKGRYYVYIEEKEHADKESVARIQVVKSY